MDLDSPSGYIHSTPLHLSAKQEQLRREVNHMTSKTFVPVTTPTTTSQADTLPTALFSQAFQTSTIPIS